MYLIWGQLVQKLEQDLPAKQSLWRGFHPKAIDTMTLALLSGHSSTKNLSAIKLGRAWEL